MKLLHLIATLNPESGGVCQALRTSIEGLKAVGVDNSVVCLDDSGEKFHEVDNFNIFPIGKGTGPWCHNKYLINWLTENLGNYDAVILHGLWLFPGYALQKALKKIKRNNIGNVPAFIVMPHGMLDPYFQKAQGRKLKALRNIVYWQVIEKNVVNNADGLFFTCEEEMHLASTYFRPYNPKKEFIVSLGVPFPLFESEKLLRKKDENYILFLSRIHPKKGIDLLVEAYAELSTIYNNIPNLVIAGPGLDSAYGKEIFNTVQINSEIRDKVSFKGMLTGEAKWDAFYNCEAFILPSHQENFGIAVVEALSCGRPVLITDKVNIWREIETDNAGFVESDTNNGIKKLIQKWIRLNEQQKLDMSNSAKACYASNFTVKIAAAKMINSLTSIVERNS